MFPEEDEDFWTIFLQYPVLSWMDYQRKSSVLRIINEVAASGSVDNVDCDTVSNYAEYCVATVETYAVTEYRES